MVPNTAPRRDVFAKGNSVDDKNSSPWAQNLDFTAQKLAWQEPTPLTEAARVIDGDHAVHSPSASGDSRHVHLIDELELHAIVGAGTAFHGTLSFSGRVRIDGEFAGQILGGRLLVIGEGARVQGEIRAERVIILGGNVKADISASDGIELYVPAQVAGDLRAPEIHLDRGVKFQGTCDLSEPTTW